MSNEAQPRADEANNAQPDINPSDTRVQGQRNRNNNCRNTNNDRKNQRFKGKYEDFSDYVYDVGLPNGNQDLFTTTTREIAEYVAQEYESAGEFRLGLITQEMEHVTLPDPPGANATLAQLELYKLELKEARDKLRHRERNIGKVFPLILGQCSRTIRDRLESSPIWEQINSMSDVMALLTLIRQLLYQRSMNRQATHTLHDAQESFFKFRQGEKMTNSDYLERFKSLVEVLEHQGEEIGNSQTRVNSFLNDPEYANGNQIEQAQAQAREEYLAVALILKSDKRRYGDLVTDLVNEHTRGLEGYPDTISKAYDMLVHYKPVHNER